jgi:heme/copper-type cytochrome/quinol oxidase subunit 4
MSSLDLLKQFAVFGASSVLINKSSSFTDVPAVPAADNSNALGTFIIVFLVIIIITYILLLMATYKLTHSVTQTILCFIFGIIYLIFAYIYYGFSGYKFAKK